MPVELGCKGCSSSAITFMGVNLPLYWLLFWLNGPCQIMTNVLKLPCDVGILQASPADAPEKAKDRRLWVLLATIVGLSMAFIDGMVVNGCAAGPVYAGIASGVNNAVARTASLLAIAILGIIILAVFNGALDSKLALLHVPSATRHPLDGEQVKLAGAQVPAACQSHFGEPFNRQLRNHL